MIEISSEKKKRISGKTIAIAIFLTIITTVVAGGAYLISIFNKYEKVEIDKEAIGVVEDNLTDEQKEVKNIALFGIDAESGESGRSDAIMILSLDDKNRKVKLTSIMRDSYVDINGQMDKINHAYSYGGPELAIKTINQNFGLNIKDFITVNFKSLGDIVDILGGIQMQITEEELTHVPGISGVGVHTLNGEQALAYARIRYAEGGDYQRTQRQRNIMESIYQSFRYTSVTEYPDMISSFLPYVTTNMSLTDMLGIATGYADILSAGLEQHRFPRDGEGNGTTKNGVYYLEYDLDIAGDAIKKFIYDSERVPFGQ